MLRAYLFGGLRVDVEGRAIPPESWTRFRLARKLFCRLALAPRHRLHRDELVDALWGERLPTDPDNRLSQEASNVQRILMGAPGTEPRYVQRDDQLIVLSPDEPLWTDVEAFSRLAREALGTRDAAAYEAAAERYGSAEHGNVLLPEYAAEPWVARRQQELRDSYGTLLLQLARLRAADNRLQDAEQALKRLLAEMPAHEEAHRGLMCLYARLGQRDRAAQQFTRLREELQREFGTDVSPKTAELHQRIATNGFCTAAMLSVPVQLIAPPTAQCPRTEGQDTATCADENDYSAARRGIDTQIITDLGEQPRSAIPCSLPQHTEYGWQWFTARVFAGVLGLLLVTNLVAAVFGYVAASEMRRIGAPGASVLVEAARPAQAQPDTDKELLQIDAPPCQTVVVQPDTKSSLTYFRTRSTLPARRALMGVWEGYWDGLGPARIAVQAVPPPDHVEGWYAYGIGPRFAEGGTYRFDGIGTTDGTFGFQTPSGARYFFAISSDFNTLRGTREQDSSVSSVAMSRCAWQ